jgi:hypothetical protein
MLRSGCNDQISDSRKAVKSMFIAAHGSAKAGNLIHPAGNQSRLRIIAIAKAQGDSAGESYDILHRAAKLHAENIVIRVNTHNVIHKDLLNACGGFLILAGGYDRRRQIQRDLLRVSRSRQGNQADMIMLSVLPQLISDHLRQCKERIRLDPLRHVHNQLAVRNKRAGGFRGRPHKHRRHREQDNIFSFAGFADHFGKMNLIRYNHPRKVRMSPARAVLLHFSLQSRPYSHLMAAHTEHSGKRHSPGTRSKHSYLRHTFHPSHTKPQYSAVAGTFSADQPPHAVLSGSVTAESSAAWR